MREVTLLGQNVNSYNDDSMLPRDTSPAAEAEDPYGAYAEVISDSPCDPDVCFVKRIVSPFVETYVDIVPE